MSSLANLIGTPWALEDNPPETFNCWSLVLYVRAHFGLTTPPIRTTPDLARLPAAAMEEIQAGRWDLLERGFTGGDVVLLGRTWHHCAVMIDGRNAMHAFSHDLKTGAVRCDPLPMLKRLYSSYEVYRCTSS